MGSAVNFIQQRTYAEKTFFINGEYSRLTLPFAAIDGLELMNYDATIINVFMFVHTAGISGTTELDVKYATTPGGSWTSIFTTTPKIQYTAGDFAWCYIGTSFTNTTAPVLNVANLNAGTVLRCDILQAQGGLPRGCGIVPIFQPR